MKIFNRKEKSADNSITGNDLSGFLDFNINGGKRKILTQSELIKNYTGIAYRCANINAQHVASLNYSLYAKKQSSKRFPFTSITPKDYFELSKKYKIKSADDVIELLEHPALTLLQRPNTQQTGYDFLELIQLFLELSGNAYILIIKDRVNTPNGSIEWPSQLIPLYPQCITPNINTLTGLVDYYTYSPIDGGAVTNYTTDQVIHVKFQDPRTGVSGKSPLEAVIDDSELLTAISKYQLNILSGVANPPILKVPKGTSAENKIRLAAQFLANHLGFKRAGIPLVLEDTMDYSPMATITQDMGLLEHARYSKDNVINAFGVPKSKFDLSASRAEAEVHAKSYLEDTVLPRADRISAVINHYILPLFDSSLIFEFENPVKDDLDIFRRTTCVTINENRAILGLAPLPDGDVFPKSTQQPQTTDNASKSLNNGTPLNKFKDS